MFKIGICPKCAGAMKRKIAGFNPFGLLLPVGTIEKVAACSKCGYRPETWNGEPNTPRLTKIHLEQDKDSVELNSEISQSSE
jgi:C4-type Zn-finger protein